MVKTTKDPFAIKEWGGDISDRDVKGWSDRAFEGATLGETALSSLRRVIGQRVPLALLIIFLFLFCVLVARVIWLQGVQGSYWRGVAEGNRIRLEIVPASRGLIVDRRGKILARNVPSFRLVGVPGELPTDEVEREEYLNKVLATVPTELLFQDNITRLAQVSASYLPLIIAAPLPHDLALQLMILVGQENGLRVEPTSQRNYFASEAMAHILGYVGPVTAEEYAAAANTYQQTDYKGKVGVELIYENDLRGKPGVRQVEVDAKGLERKIFATQPAIDGAKLGLTIDSELQQVAYAALGRAVNNSGGQGGSVIVMRPQDGAILAMVSYPSFVSNVFTSERNSEVIKKLLQDTKQPLFNRAVSGVYPPGSTIKPLIASAALAEGVITPATSFLSTGGIKAGSDFFADWKAGGHGVTNVYKAIAQSVNTFFYLIGGGSREFTGLGISRLSNYFKKFGLGARTGVDLPSEQTGFVPTPLWKQAVLHDRWYRGDTYNVAIGQGNLTVTPLQLAVVYAALATDGRLVTPHLANELILATGEKRKFTFVPVGNVGLSQETLSVIQQAMRQTVTAGSARSLVSLPLSVAGKTGTAQTGTKTKTHAWFVGYAPSQAPAIVVVVMVEYGGEGSQVAVPVAREIFSWYAEHQADF